MARRKRSTKLSAGELRLMGILWEKGPLTLADAFLLQSGQLGYTTIQTQLNRLVEKGVASRSRARPMKYRALMNPQEAGAALLKLLIDTVGGGSIIPLVAQLVSHAPLSVETARELTQIIVDATPRRSRLKKQAVKRKRKSG